MTALFLMPWPTAEVEMQDLSRRSPCRLGQPKELQARACEYHRTKMLPQKLILGSDELLCQAIVIGSRPILDPRFLASRYHTAQCPSSFAREESRLGMQTSKTR